MKKIILFTLMLFVLGACSNNGTIGMLNDEIYEESQKYAIGLVGDYADLSTIEFCDIEDDAFRSGGNNNYEWMTSCIRYVNHEGWEQEKHYTIEYRYNHDYTEIIVIRAYLSAYGS